MSKICSLGDSSAASVASIGLKRDTSSIEVARRAWKRRVVPIEGERTERKRSLSCSAFGGSANSELSYSIAPLSSTQSLSIKWRGMFGAASDSVVLLMGDRTARCAAVESGTRKGGVLMVRELCLGERSAGDAFCAEEGDGERRAFWTNSYGLYRRPSTHSSALLPPCLAFESSSPLTYSLDNVAR